MIELDATLTGHKKTKPDSSWAVAELEVGEARLAGDEALVPGAALPAELRPGSRIAAVGARMGLVAVGEGVRLKGVWGPNPYGSGFQLRVEEQATLGVKTATQAHRWLERLDGVGPTMARRLAERFGDRVVDVLSTPPAPGEPDPLLTVEGIGDVVAATIRESWTEVGASGDLEDVRYLDSLGLTRFQANTVLDFAKRKERCKPKELLERKPYALTKAKGFGFLTTDKVAIQAGTPPNAPARIDAAVVHTASELCQADTSVLLGELVSRAAALVGVQSSLTYESVLRLAESGELVFTDDAQGRKWVHPFELMQAERTILRVLREGEERAQEVKAAASAPAPAVNEDAEDPEPDAEAAANRARGWVQDEDGRWRSPQPIGDSTKFWEGP